MWIYIGIFIVIVMLLLCLRKKKRIMLFHSLKCPHCVKFMPTWEKLVNKYGNDVQMDKIDVNGPMSDSDQMFLNSSVCKGVPCIMSASGRVFNDDRTVSNLSNFVEGTSSYAWWDQWGG